MKRTYYYIGIDMSVVENNKEYYVSVNRKYTLDEMFINESDAEERLIEIANIRNSLEEELKNY